MNLEQRINAFVQLGVFLADFREQKKDSPYSIYFKGFEEIITLSFIENGWFTRDNVLEALKGIELFCAESGLKELCSELEPVKNTQTIAVLMAGNIPAVGFHDFLCVILSGNRILLKLSSDDRVLIPFFVRFLVEIEPGLESYILFASGKLQNFDAVIATGSNNTSRYFEYYFGKYPNIIRKNRNSIAVLNGTESSSDFQKLGKDIFTYFGLGCRNVSKVMVPSGYDFKLFFESILPFSSVIENKKYANNYDYNRAVYLLNKEDFLDNNFLILKKDNYLSSPVSALFYEEYSDLIELTTTLKNLSGQIQVIVSGMDLQLPSLPFGMSQKPAINDFADNTNTMRFISELNT